MKSHTAYMTFETRERRQLIRITEEVQAAVEEAGIAEGMVLVSAMHITAGVWVNDDEPGLHEDVLEWLDKIAPPSWAPAAERGRRANCFPTAATTATTAAARTTATPTSRTCSSTTRRSSPSPPAASTSAPGSRSSTASSTAAARSGW